MPKEIKVGWTVTISLAVSLVVSLSVSFTWNYTTVNSIVNERTSTIETRLSNVQNTISNQQNIINSLQTVVGRRNGVPSTYLTTSPSEASYGSSKVRMQIANVTGYSTVDIYFTSGSVPNIYFAKDPSGPYFVLDCKLVVPNVCTSASGHAILTVSVSGNFIGIAGAEGPLLIHARNSS